MILLEIAAALYIASVIKRIADWIPEYRRHLDDERDEANIRIVEEIKTATSK